ncbi:MAG: baseplate J/gp47 family protein [Anaerolineae bacterium]|nr:baseplate J/gp47 family protein [Anaerolineae bacterium]
MTKDERSSFVFRLSSAMHQVIQLQPDDDIVAIRARIESAELAHLILVVPRRCAFLEGASGFPLLRRAADDLGAQIALVLHDETLRERAEEYGFPVFRSIAQAQFARWKMRPPKQTTSVITPSVPPPPPPESVSDSRITRFIREWRWQLLGAASIVLIICVAMPFVIPAAQVYIVPAPMALTTTTEIVIDSSVPYVSSAMRSVPARRLLRETSGTGSLRTTTTKTMPDARATGSVVFTNLRAEETIVPQGTVVATSTGVPIRFTTTLTATLPAQVGARVEAPIQAIDPGPSGNVKELAINVVEGSLALAVRVINTKPTTSGTVRPVRVATEADRKKLEDQVLAQIRQNAYSVLAPALKPDEFIPPDSIQVYATNRLFDRAVDEPADVLNLTLSADVFGLAVDRDNLNLLMSTLLQRQLPAGYQLLPNSVRVEMLAGGKYQGIQLRQPVRAIGYAAPQLDPGKVAAALQGKTVDDAQTYLTSQIQLAQPPIVRVTPPGWPLLPFLAFRIAVFIETPVVEK